MRRRAPLLTAAPPPRAQFCTPVLEEIHANCEALVQDQYGNYVVQHLLEHGRPADRARVAAHLRGKVLAYSQHKFASNVVERCLQFGAPADRRSMVEEVLVPDAEGGMPLDFMAKDPFANYVVQKVRAARAPPPVSPACASSLMRPQMLELADVQHRDVMVARVRAMAPQLKRFTYGKHILARVEKISGTALA